MTKYKIFSLKLANELVDKGFVLLGTGINIKFPKYKVFYFEDTPELREAIKK